MKTILVVTNSRDLTVDYIIGKYGSEVSIYRYNVDRFDEYEITFSNNGHFFTIANQHWCLNSSQISAVYYRKPELPDLSEYEEKFRYLMQREIMAIVEGLVETVGDVALTRPSILRRADNKILQLQLAKKIGFSLPTSVITNSVSSVQQLINKTKAVVKPLSYGRIMDIKAKRLGIIQTNLVDPAANFESLELSPAYFQYYIQKDMEIRATIVGREVFAVQINSSDPIDWRKQDAIIEYKPIQMPKEIVQKCFELMDELQLSFGAFDFIVHNGEYIFLEINANGQWLWLEEATKLNISWAIINHLKGETISE
ncbi:hypothetical protein AM501_28630 [Aneurinibacillus migulanus]|uniref:MvdC/MvdD family ATP grasp protein n=1 Tax=Aneurinibacillus migulanus TaxID=47500 RepID=UPI0005B7E0B5|nr:hypothetical protein [Aneurinibacillus migulanus]KIV58389.1 hypothetical protein TS64_04840 [Aneurinibacillus migulanus]KPD05017.1 hypothetical protein AM501_28630 [Aneurinibacillus migulanus]